MLTRQSSGFFDDAFGKSRLKLNGSMQQELMENSSYKVVSACINISIFPVKLVINVCRSHSFAVTFGKRNVEEDAVAS